MTVNKIYNSLNNNKCYKNWYKQFKFKIKNTNKYKNTLHFQRDEEVVLYAMIKKNYNEKIQKSTTLKTAAWIKLNLRIEILTKKYAMVFSHLFQMTLNFILSCGWQ